MKRTCLTATSIYDKYYLRLIFIISPLKKLISTSWNGKCFSCIYIYVCARCIKMGSLVNIESEPLTKPDAWLKKKKKTSVDSFFCTAGIISWRVQLVFVVAHHLGWRHAACGLFALSDPSCSFNFKENYCTWKKLYPKEANAVIHGIAAYANGAGASHRHTAGKLPDNIGRGRTLHVNSTSRSSPENE